MKFLSISIKQWLLNKLDIQRNKKNADISYHVLFDLMEDYRIRELAFHTCVSLIANALGKCEFKTYRNYEEIKEKEYWLWNFEPNTNQNSTAFLHKMVYKLYTENEALVIAIKKENGQEILVVVDSFQKPLEYPTKIQEYTNVVVGEVTFQKIFFENEVLHFKLQQKNIKPILDGLYQSYYQLVSSAMQNYKWANGKHWKVHVNQIAQANTSFEQNFTDMINKQVKPFLQSENGVLPEFDGYQFEDIGGKSDTNRTTRDIRALVDDIFDFTARAFGIPPVLLLGDIAGTKDAMERWLTTCIDPLCDQIQEEIVRKRYGYQLWKKGDFLKIDTSAMLHFDLFGNATNIEKLIGSGAFSINDVLRASGQTEIHEEWANTHYMTLNISNMENVTKDLKRGETA